MAPNSDICDEWLSAYPLSDFLPHINHGIGIGGLILGIFYFFSASITIFWIHQQSKNAQAGIQGAAYHVVLPFYLPFLYFSAISDLFVGFCTVFINTKHNEEEDSNSMTVWLKASILALAFACQHLVIESVAFILMQYGCGYQAMMNTTLWGILWGICTFFVYLTLYKDGNQTSYIAETCWSGLLLLFYFALWLLPETTLFRRSAVIYYARFWSILRVGILLSTASVRFGPSGMILMGDCLYDLFVLPAILLLKPYVLYRSLLIDSQWWQGLEGIGTTATTIISSRSQSRRQSTNHHSHRHRYDSGVNQSSISGGSGSVLSSLLAYLFTGWNLLGEDSESAGGINSRNGQSGVGGGRQDGYQAIRGPLLGVEVGYSEAQGLAREIDSLHQQGTVKLLNFAYLKVDQRAKLGAGSFSTVYMGLYKQTPVAIKMLVTLDLNPDVIRRCNTEARILTEVAPHPNVVTIYGLAVLPPSVCLVLEICEFGSLSDILRGNQLPGGSNNSNGRRALPLTLSDRMFLAMGCARGVQALHSYSPSLCHRDIKSFNFLIDSQLNAKIADLDLGNDEDISSGREEGNDGVDEEEGGDGNSPNTLPSIFLAHNAGSSYGNRKKSRGGVYERVDSSQSLVEGMRRMPNYTGTNMTWQAPEILLGMPYTQKADIYSLGLVFWEIIAAGRVKKKFTNIDGEMTTISEPFDSVPFSECKNQQEIREKIVLGGRPSLQGYTLHSSTTTTSNSSGNSSSSNGTPRSRSKSLISNPYSTQGTVESVYVDMIRRCWSAEPQQRPSLQEILQILSYCYNRCLHRYIMETPYLVDCDVVHAEHLRLSFLSSHASSYPLSNPLLPSTTTTMTTTTTSNTTSTSPFYPSPQVGGRPLPHPLSAEFARHLTILQKEAAWSLLDQNNFVCYFILTPRSPYYLLFANKKALQTFGYMLLDLLAREFDSLLGYNPANNLPLATSVTSSATVGGGGVGGSPEYYNIDSQGNEMHDRLRETLRLVSQFGLPQHFLAQLQRRDGRQMLCSLHAHPVYKAEEDLHSYYQAAATATVAPPTPPSMDTSPERKVDCRELEEEEDSRANRSCTVSSSGRCESDSASEGAMLLPHEQEEEEEEEVVEETVHSALHDERVRSSDSSHYRPTDASWGTIPTGGGGRISSVGGGGVGGLGSVNPKKRQVAYIVVECSILRG